MTDNHLTTSIYHERDNPDITDYFKRGLPGKPINYPIITMEPVLIVGAGIVGLTLGQALQKVMNALFAMQIADRMLNRHV